MEITRDDLRTLKEDLIRELGGRLDRIDVRLAEGDRRIEDHEVQLAVLKRQADHIESRVELEIQPKIDKLERRRPYTDGSGRVGEWPWKLLLGVVTVLTLLMQLLVRLAEALVHKL